MAEKDAVLVPQPPAPGHGHPSCVMQEEAAATDVFLHMPPGQHIVKQNPPFSFLDSPSGQKS